MDSCRIQDSPRRAMAMNVSTMPSMVSMPSGQAGSQSRCLLSSRVVRLVLVFLWFGWCSVGFGGLWVVFGWYWHCVGWLWVFGRFRRVADVNRLLAS